MSRPRIVAHRGASAEAPENTVEAFRLAVELGADALELDVRSGAGGEPVVIHDATLDRTTDGRGPVATRTAAELESLGVPRLTRVLEAHPGIEITVDVKDPGVTEDVVERIRAGDRTERTVLYVEDGTGLPSFRSYPGRRATSTRQALRLALVDRWLPGLPTAAVPEVVHTPMRRHGVPIVTRGFVDAMHRSGRSVQVWTVDDPAVLRRLADWSVDAVVTNDVRAAVALYGAGAAGSEQADANVGTDRGRDGR